MVNSAKASLPPLQPPNKPPAMTLPLPGLLPMQPPSDLTTFAEGLFCTLLEVTSSFTPDNSRLEPPTYLKKKARATLVNVYAQRHTALKNIQLKIMPSFASLAPLRMLS